MSFNINYLLLRGEVLSVAGGKASDPVVLIKCSLFDQNMTFKIACPDDLVALRVSEFIKNKFDHGETVSFSGTLPKSGFVTVLTPCEDFLTEAVEK